MRPLLRELSAKNQFILALGIVSLIGIGLFAYASIDSHSFQYSYLLWNLCLAWIPLLFSYRLVQILKNKSWSSWEALVLSIFWLLFLPNSFYMISDYIHIQSAPGNQLLLYSVAFSSIIYTAVVLGFLSLYMVHIELKRRFNERESAYLVALVLLCCSIAIYIGRDLRWNSWDVLTNPGGIIFDTSDQLLHFNFYPQAISITAEFFILLCGMYFLIWSGVRLIRQR